MSSYRIIFYNNYYYPEVEVDGEFKRIPHNKKLLGLPPKRIAGKLLQETKCSTLEKAKEVIDEHKEFIEKAEERRMRDLPKVVWESKEEE